MQLSQAEQGQGGYLIQRGFEIVIVVVQGGRHEGEAEASPAHGVASALRDAAATQARLRLFRVGGAAVLAVKDAVSIRVCMCRCGYNTQHSIYVCSGRSGTPQVKQTMPEPVLEEAPHVEGTMADQ